MDHVALDRTATDDRNLDHKGVKGSRAEPGKHGHLGPALELKDPDGIAAPDHLEDRRIVVRDGRHRQIDHPVALEKLKAVIQVGQRPETQEIDFEQVHVFHVVLVPLDHRPIGHGGVLYRHEGVNRLAP